MVMTKWKRPLVGLALALGLAIAAVGFVVAAVGPRVAAAQDAGTDSGDDRASAFRAVEGGDAEQVPGGTLLLSAYGVMWLFVFAYIFRMQRMHSATQAEISRLARILDTGTPEDAEG